MSLLLGPVRRTSRTAQQLVLLALPHGGQQLARRNAWASMATDSARARARREADAALSVAVSSAVIAAAPRTAAAQ
jgi:hypothetical protein